MTGLLSAVSVVLSVVFTNVIMEIFSAGINIQGLVVSILMPLALGSPIIALILYKHEQLRQANSLLTRLANIDWLTDCLNRGAFTSAVNRHLASPHAKGAMLVIDVDHFKALNDRHGHDRGDEALRLIAGTLSKSIGETALLGRLGGEEFGVFLPQANDAETSGVAETIRKAIAGLGFIAEGKNWPISISIGGASFARATDFRTLYRLADDYLYKAKAAGRDCVALTRAA